MSDGSIHLIWQAKDKVMDAFKLGIKDDIDQAFKALFDVFEKFYPKKTNDGDLVYLQLEILLLELQHHLMEGDSTNLSVRSIQFMETYKQIHDHFEPADDYQKDIDKQVKAMMARIREYLLDKQLFDEDLFDEAVHQEDVKSCKCALCKKAVADKTGSHLVPHFLIQQMFSFDGKKGRQREAITEYSLSEMVGRNYLGRNVGEEMTSELLDRPLSEVEKEDACFKKNSLTRDFIFCKACENRLGILEGYYADILHGKLKKYPPQIPYLFWMSVIWRMAVGSMGTVITRQDCESYRCLLDKCLSDQRENIQIDLCAPKKCAYELFQFEDTRDETLIISGFHDITFPYRILIGNYGINFYRSYAKAVKHFKKSGHDCDLLNDGSSPELMVHSNFINFWLFKRSVMDFNEEVTHPYNKSSNIKDVAQLRNYQKEMEADGVEGFTSNHVSRLMVSKQGASFMMPCSVMKIQECLKDNPKIKIEELVNKIGYSKEEIETMLCYWLDSMHVDND